MDKGDNEVKITFPCSNYVYGTSAFCSLDLMTMLSKKISNDQELIQSDPTSCPQNLKGNN